MNAQSIIENLPYFTGTESYYRHSAVSGALVITDGVKYVRDHCQAFWLIDLIISYQKQLLTHHFQVWKLTKDKDDSCTIMATDGNDNLLIAQDIPYTDFPLESITFYIESGVCLLPSEH